MKFKNKNGQMEIIGLVVIFILLALLSLVFLTFALRPKVSTTDILRTSTKADNLLNSIIRTNTEKGNILDLITEAHIKGDFTYIKQEISKITDKTLSNRQYSLKILINQENILKIGSCKTGISSTKSIKHQTNLFKFILIIC